MTVSCAKDSLEMYNMESIHFQSDRINRQTTQTESHEQSV